jgi:hypothetical protein
MPPPPTVGTPPEPPPPTMGVPPKPPVPALIFVRSTDAMSSQALTPRRATRQARGRKYFDWMSFTALLQMGDAAQKLPP